MSLGLDAAQQQQAVSRVEGSRRATLAYSPPGGTAEIGTSAEPPPGEDSYADIDDGDTG